MVLPLWEGVIMAKTYVLVDEDGTPVYVTENYVYRRLPWNSHCRG